MMLGHHVPAVKVSSSLRCVCRSMETIVLDILSCVKTFCPACVRRGVSENGPARYGPNPGYASVKLSLAPARNALKGGVEII